MVARFWTNSKGKLLPVLQDRHIHGSEQMSLLNKVLGISIGKAECIQTLTWKCEPGTGCLGFCRFYQEMLLQKLLEQDMG